MNFFKKIKNFVKENFLLCILFIISTLFFFIQHKFFLSWDFSSYVINARYLFYGGEYFEVYRAPLVSFLLGFFMLFGSFSHYLYLFFVSGLFFFSTLKLADSIYENYLFEKKVSKKIVRLLFYLLLLTPFMLRFALIEGTELLALSFFQLFLSAFITNRVSGHFLGLAFLSRYNFLLFSIFLFFNKNYKKIIKNMLLFVATIFPWLLFNYYKWGNFLTSPIDSYFLNVLSRQGMIESFNFLNLLKPFGYLLPLFLVGIIVIFASKDFKKKTNLIFLSILALFLFEIYNIPFKVERYMFNLILPIGFFSLIGLIYLIKRFFKIKKILVGLLFCLFISSIFSFGIFYFNNRHNGDVFIEASEIIEDLGYQNCKIVSNYWVPVNYYSNNIYYLTSPFNAINRGEIVLIFKGFTTMDDQFREEELGTFPILYENDFMFLFGKDNLTIDSCIKKEKYDFPMVSSPCDVFSKKASLFKLESFAKEVCLLFNKR